MIKLPKSKEFLSAVLATIGVAVFGVAGWFGLTKFDSIDQGDYEAPVKSQDEVANLGSTYIKTLPLYKQDENPILLLSKTELLEPEMWLVQYNLSSTTGLSYALDLTVQEGQVIHHNIKAQDKTGSLILFEPEPDEVIASDTFLIKGSSLKGEEVVISLVSDAQRVVLSKTVKSLDLKDNLFSQQLTVKGGVAGNYKLQLSTNGAKLAIPVVISPKV